MHLVDAPRDDDSGRSAIRGGTGELFRSEALNAYLRAGSDEGHLLEIEPGWARYAYAVILALFAAALLLAFAIRIDREAEGAGVVRQGRLVAVVPAQFRSELRPAMPLHFELSEHPLAVRTVSAKVIAPSEARRILGADGAAFWNGREAAVAVEASLPKGADDFGDGVAGRVRIRLGRERVLVALLPALGRLHV